MKKYRYAVRVIEAGRSLEFWSTAPTIQELKTKIDSSPSPLLILDTPEFGPAMIHRDHIIIINKEAEDVA